MLKSVLSSKVLDMETIYVFVVISLLILDFQLALTTVIRSEAWLSGQTLVPR